MVKRLRRASRAPALDLRVIDAVPAGHRPTVQVKFVDAGDLFLTWRWEHALDEPRVLMVPRSEVAPALTALQRAAPTPAAGESVRNALTRALAGPLADREAESELSSDLARALLPWYLAAELNALVLRGIRPHVRIQSSPSLAQVPWEALRVDDGERFVHHADVSVLLPAGVRHAPHRQISAHRPDGRLVAVLDPAVPGADPDLGWVLPPITASTELGQALLSGPTTLALGDGSTGTGTSTSTSTSTEDVLLSRHRVDRDALQQELRGSTQWLFTGHVSAGEHALGAALHLSCTAQAPGRGPVLSGHRPLTAADLAYGHRDGAPWQFPNRVALLACNSGGEARFAEPTGLVAVIARGGAEYVTAARWTLATDAGLAELSGTGAEPFRSAVQAVTAAHRMPDPVAALCSWQRARADRWEAHGCLVDSPLVWAALSTAYAPGPTPSNL